MDLRDFTLLRWRSQLEARMVVVLALLNKANLAFGVLDGLDALFLLAIEQVIVHLRVLVVVLVAC